MKSALKFVMALLVTILVMLTFRALFFTIYTVDGDALKPSFIKGDRMLVNRWSYGLRTGDGKLFDYTRWVASQPRHGDLVAFNYPLDTTVAVGNRKVYFCYCKAVPGDTIDIVGTKLKVPGRNHIVKATKSNMRLLSFIYNHYEGRKSEVKDSTLYVDGKETRCASFKYDYYWVTSGSKSNCNDSRYFGFVPETHIIGKAAMLLYSVDSSKPLYDCLRTDRTLLFINSGVNDNQQNTSK